MKDLGLVSIITPSYNCANFINETIKSILSQTYRNWELIITDDCSTDNSREIIQGYCDKDQRTLEPESPAIILYERLTVDSLPFATVMTAGIQTSCRNSLIL